MSVIIIIVSWVYFSLLLFSKDSVFSLMLYFTFSVFLSLAFLMALSGFLPSPVPPSPQQTHHEELISHSSCSSLWQLWPKPGEINTTVQAWRKELGVREGRRTWKPATWLWEITVVREGQECDLSGEV